MHAPTKSAMAEGIELRSLNGRVRNLTAELSANAWRYNIDRAISI